MTKPNRGDLVLWRSEQPSHFGHVIQLGILLDEPRDFLYRDGPRGPSPSTWSLVLTDGGVVQRVWERLEVVT